MVTDRSNEPDVEIADEPTLARTVIEEPVEDDRPVVLRERDNLDRPEN